MYLQCNALPLRICWLSLLLSMQTLDHLLHCIKACICPLHPLSAAIQSCLVCLHELQLVLDVLKAVLQVMKFLPGWVV